MILSFLEKTKHIAWRCIFSGDSVWFLGYQSDPGWSPEIGAVAGRQGQWGFELDGRELETCWGNLYKTIGRSCVCDGLKTWWCFQVFWCQVMRCFFFVAMSGTKPRKEMNCRTVFDNLWYISNTIKLWYMIHVYTPPILFKHWPAISTSYTRSGGLLIFNSSTAQLYGRGAGPKDALTLLAEESPVSLVPAPKCSKGVWRCQMLHSGKLT